MIQLRLYLCHTNNLGPRVSGKKSRSLFLPASTGARKKHCEEGWAGTAGQGSQLLHDGLGISWPALARGWPWLEARPRPGAATAPAGAGRLAARGEGALVMAFLL